MTQGLRHTLTLVIGIALGAGAAVAWLNATPPAPAAKVASVAAPSRAAAPAPAAPSGLTAQDQQRLTEILQRVRREYVDEVPRERLLDDAARGMVSSLDAYSAYLDQREYEEIRRGAAGNYPGIGIEVAAEGKAIKVLRPLSDSPAERAGLRSGDEIVRIDDAPVGRDVEEAIEQMRGPAGSRVRLTVRRAGSGELVDVSLERTRVEVHSVSGQMLAANRAYVRIVAFSDTTLADLEAVLKSLRQTHQIAGLVLDLRNNPLHRRQRASCGSRDARRRQYRVCRRAYTRCALSHGCETRPVAQRCRRGRAGQRRLGFRRRNSGRCIEGQPPRASRRATHLRQRPGAKRDSAE
ncbi:MAG: PDZ domain-containing protein [Gammaproteobacteria bacterium]|nr:PDZ domain-containing protein [Gammaproteobacteria bacterium]